MPEPIQSARREPRATEDDLTCHDTPAQAPPAGTGGEASTCALDIDWASHDVVQMSVDYSRVEAMPPSRSAKSAPPSVCGPALDNARRTAEREAGPYAEAGVTRYETGVFAGVALDKGTAYDGMTSREILSASAQAGLQNEVQAAAVRGGLSVASGAATATVDVGTAKANVGFLNGDGSIGMNAGALATIASVEATVGRDFSLTAGVGIGAGAEISMGIRDADDDGLPEVCVRVGGAFGGKVVLGACVEF